MKMAWILFPMAALIAVVLTMLIWRQLDHRADRLAWNKLAELDQHDRPVFNLNMVSALPEPARRYFAFTIEPGTPLYSAVRIVMTGEIGRGTLQEHTYTSMQAEQILAPPHGLVWKVQFDHLSGSDGAMPTASWTRFWLFGLLPVVRAAGPDHQRSAFGRVVAEAAIWAPASLLLSDTVTWEAVDADTARAIVRFGDFEQAVDITVDEDGAPIEFVIPRWSNENPEKVFRVQPFGGVGSDFKQFGGYHLPTRVEGGNHFGTEDYFPFYKADVISVDPA